MRKEIILKEIDSKSGGAPTRSLIGEDRNNHLYIIKNKTSSSVSLATTAPVCSKTIKFLNENDIKIIFDYIIK